MSSPSPCPFRRGTWQANVERRKPLGEGFFGGPRRAVIYGIRREKARKARRGRGAAKDFEQERTEKTDRKNFAKNALFLDLALQERRNCSMADERDYAVVRGFSRCRLMGKRHQQNGEREPRDVERLKSGREWTRKDGEGAPTEKCLRPYLPGQVAKDWGAYESWRFLGDKAKQGA